MDSNITSLLQNNLIKKIELSPKRACKTLLSAWQSRGFGCQEYQNKGELPAISAIYVVIHDDKVLYIGQASDLKRRFTNHHRALEFSKRVGATVFWFKVDEKVLLSVESLCIDILSPELNGKPVIKSTSGTKPNTTVVLSAEELEFIEEYYCGPTP